MLSRKVTVINRKQAESRIAYPYTAMISITAPSYPADLHFSWTAMLHRSEFHDVIPEHGIPLDKAPVYFDPEMAKKMLDFIDNYQQMNFAVHCEAGVSRSVAVGDFIHRRHGHQIILEAAHSDMLRNVHVSNLLTRAAMEKDDA